MTSYLHIELRFNSFENNNGLLVNKILTEYTDIAIFSNFILFFSLSCFPFFFFFLLGIFDTEPLTIHKQTH